MIDTTTKTTPHTGNHAADRALLELAAKAAGHAVEGYSGTRGLLIEVLNGISAWWNPLRPADALGLAARLRIDVTHNHPADQDAWVCAEPVASSGRPVSAMVDVPDEARRLECMCLAINRAAAAIGRAMP